MSPVSPVSTVPAVKAGLQQQLLARSGLVDVEVSYGRPTNQQLEFIWLAGVTSHTMTPTGMHDPGGMPLEEEYDLDVIIHVEQPGRDQQACDERLYALVAEIQAQLQSDPRSTVCSARAAGGRICPRSR